MKTFLHGVVFWVLLSTGVYAQPVTTPVVAPSAPLVATVTATPSQTTVDISGFLNVLLQTMGAVILAVGGTLGTIIAVKLRAKYGIQFTDAQAAQLQDTANKSLTWAITQSAAAIKAKGWDDPDVHSVIAKQAAEYAIAQFPEVMANNGLDVSSPAAITATAKVLAANVMTRVLPAAMTTAAASPATPAAPEPAPTIVVATAPVAKP